MKVQLRRLVVPLLMLGSTVLIYAQSGKIDELTGVNPKEGTTYYVLMAVGYFVLAWLGGRLVSVALERASSKKRRVPRLLQEVVAAAFFLVALIATGMLFVGQSGAGALASSGLVIAVLGFAIRNVVADALSGIALGLEAPFRIGDWVEFDGTIRGQVTEIGWRTTRILTKDSAYMILPNSQIARQKLTNYSAPRRHYRAQTTITLAYDLDLLSTKRLLLKAMLRVDSVLGEPQPDVRILSFSLEGVTYALRYWVPSFALDIDCRDQVLQAVGETLREHAVPGPYRSVRLFGQEPDRSPTSDHKPVIVPDGVRAEWIGRDTNPSSDASTAPASVR